MLEMSPLEVSITADSGVALLNLLIQRVADPGSVFWAV